MSMPQILKLLAKGPRIVYIAATDGRYGGAMAVGDGIRGVRADQLYLDIKTPLEEWIHKIQEFKPNMIIGYSSAIKILGELVERGDIAPKIFRIISCGEPLGASLRHYLEEIFQSEVISFYGASESLAIGVETNSAEGICIEGLRDYQFRQICQDSFEMLAEVSEHVSKDGIRDEIF